MLSPSAPAEPARTVVRRHETGEAQELRSSIWRMFVKQSVFSLLAPLADSPSPKPDLQAIPGSFSLSLLSIQVLPVYIPNISQTLPGLDSHTCSPDNSSISTSPPSSVLLSSNSYSPTAAEIKLLYSLLNAPLRTNLWLPGVKGAGVG